MGGACDLVGYTDSNLIVCKLERKSGMCHLLGNLLVSWHRKKQPSFALPTHVVEYVISISCHYIKQQINDYGVSIGVVPIRSDSTSDMNLTKKPKMSLSG